jgi:hypothetical protein
VTHSMTTGTPSTRTEHRVGIAALGFMFSMGVPAVLAIAGLIALGPGEVRWLDAIVWGVVATAAFTAFSMMGKAMGMTRMDLLDLMGSAFTRPGSGAAKAIGAMMHP